MNYETDIVNKATALVLAGAVKTAELNQEKIAAITGISITTVQRLFKQTTLSMKVPQFVAIAIACKRDPAELLAEVLQHAERMSQGDATVVPFPKPKTAEEIDQYQEKRAASPFNEEADASDW
ncbi:hypothetical protein [Glaciihabitans sp. UYNi722]|uniref:hypothetical protein n=1 Tax=Glaciihabitans sp. UYNi722 TaxID=3156344 RepID=UPI0033910FFD